VAELEVFLVTPVRQLWAGKATMVIARGTEGEVGILAAHAPMLIRLGIGPLRIQHDGEHWERAVVDGGFLHVTSEGDTTRVDVLADGADLEADIDKAAAERAKAEAEQRLDQADLIEVARRHAIEALARAEARLDLIGG
jgi:F-type H+-transporting ATPase subunit epsilon